MLGFRDQVDDHSLGLPSNATDGSSGMPQVQQRVHFRCHCGRSVSTEKGSLSDQLRRCSRCAMREEAPLTRPGAPGGDRRAG